MNDFFTETEIATRPAKPCRWAVCRGLSRVAFLVMLLVLIVPMQLMIWLEDKSGGDGGNSK